MHTEKWCLKDCVSKVVVSRVQAALNNILMSTLWSFNSYGHFGPYPKIK